MSYALVLRTLASAPAALRNSPAVVSAISRAAGISFRSAQKAWNWVLANPLKGSAIITAITSVPEVASWLMDSGDKEAESAKAIIQDSFSDGDRALAGIREASLKVIEADAEAKALDQVQVDLLEEYEGVAARMAKRFNIYSADGLVRLRQDIAMMVEIPGASWARAVSRVV